MAAAGVWLNSRLTELLEVSSGTMRWGHHPPPRHLQRWLPVSTGASCDLEHSQELLCLVSSTLALGAANLGQLWGQNGDITPHDAILQPYVQLLAATDACCGCTWARSCTVSSKDPPALDTDLEALDLQR
jgi:hypothetical protein